MRWSATLVVGVGPFFDSDDMETYSNCSFVYQSPRYSTVSLWKFAFGWLQLSCMVERHAKNLFHERNLGFH